MSGGANPILTIDAAIPGLEAMETGFELYVGIREGTKNDQTGADIAEYAFYNEFGTKSGIPARPAIRQTVDAHMAEYVEDLADLLLSEIMPVEAARRLGEQMAKDISQSIRDWKDPANAKSTENRKGFNDPLVETESYARAISHTVVEKE